MTALVRLRPVVESDLQRLTRFLDDPVATGEYEWFGFRVDRVRELERRWREDGLIGLEQSHLAVEVGGKLAGWVTWLPVARSAGIEIGIALFPEFRGQGFGTEAQRQLVDLLFATTPVHRIQAGTEVDNVAEQRTLEKIGFGREGVLRGWNFRAGKWRDSVLFAITRDDL
jgi:RimJ/RimL family protein N-acetyltransferase